LSLLPLAAAFGLAIWQMRFDWIYDEAYYYGWSVLPLALYLFSLRWRDRPSPGPPLPPAILNAGWALLSLLYPLTWLVREPNPEWRPIGAALAMLAVLTSWQYLAATGGKTWLKHFAGPALFFLTSIPWPGFIEKSATSILMPANAAIALEVLHWLGIPAIRSGHLITIAGGTLGVEEACSGIRSLQSTLMMAWFLGELHHLRFATRGTLLACGVACALFTNTLRTVFLSAIAAHSGLAAAHSWHDTAGFLALGTNLLLLLFLAVRFSDRRNTAPRSRSRPSGPENAASASLPAADPVLPFLPIARAPLLVFAFALLAIFPLTSWWFTRRVMPALPTWHLAPPVQEANYRPAIISDRTLYMIRPSSSWSARWKTPAGQPLHGFFFEWKPGDAPPKNMNDHQPSGCLGAVGIELIKEFPSLSIPVPLTGTTLNARHLLFDDHGRPLHLLYLVAEATAPDPTFTAANGLEYSYFDYSNRLRNVLQGRRNPGQRVIETGLWDEPSEAAARAIFTTYLQTWIKPGQAP
jgi:exosortase